MTKKDYELIAKTFRDYMDFEWKQGHEDIARELTSFLTSADGLQERLAAGNPKFKAGDFLLSCGLTLHGSSSGSTYWSFRR